MSYRAKSKFKQIFASFMLITILCAPTMHVSAKALVEDSQTNSAAQAGPHSWLSLFCKAYPESEWCS